MIIHTIDFVHGNIKCEMIDDKFYAYDDNDNRIRLNIGDKIIWVNKLHAQSWIQTGVITNFEGSRSYERILLDNLVSINPEGECYIGIIEKGENYE